VRHALVTIFVAVLAHSPCRQHPSLFRTSSSAGISGRRKVLAVFGISAIPTETANTLKLDISRRSDAGIASGNEFVDGQLGGGFHVQRRRSDNKRLSEAAGRRGRLTGPSRDPAAAGLLRTRAAPRRREGFYVDAVGLRCAGPRIWCKWVTDQCIAALRAALHL
jgi:hypothetical protein